MHQFINSIPFRIVGFSLSLLIVIVSPQFSDAQQVDELIKTGQSLVDDNFDREELGKKWKSNDARALRTSKIPEAEFKPQSIIKNNVLEIRRTKGSDHGTSTKTNAQFKDAVFTFKFRLTGKNKFSLNFNDPNLKSVHAGHISKVEIGPKHVLIQDQKLGVMNLENRKVRLEGDAAAKKELSKKLAAFQKRIATDVAAEKWHELTLVVQGNTYNVHIDKQPVGHFTSPGLGHATKENMAFAVPVAVDIDDLKIWSLPEAEKKPKE